MLTSRFNLGTNIIRAVTLAKESWNPISKICCGCQSNMARADRAVALSASGSRCRQYAHKNTEPMIVALITGSAAPVIRQ